MLERTSAGLLVPWWPPRKMMCMLVKRSIMHQMTKWPFFAQKHMHLTGVYSRN